MSARTRVTKGALGFFLVFLMGGADSLVAQRSGGGGAQRAEMERRIQAGFDDLVREDLGLDDDQVGALQDMTDAFRVRRLEFSLSERRSRARVMGVGRGGRGGGAAADLTDEEATEMLAEMLELSDQEATLFREEQEAFLQVLRPSQVVRYIVMRQQLGDRIRGLRGGGGRGRGPQGGGSFGPIL